MRLTKALFWKLPHLWAIAAIVGAAQSTTTPQPPQAPLPPSAPAPQPAPAPPPPRFVVLLDAAHGGDDPGGRLTNQAEKDFTLALSVRLRSLLAARGFQV